MKRIFSLFVAALFCAAMFAETKTIYCKMTQNWWTVGDETGPAAVAVHYWGGSATGTEWPGVRMTAVEGENGVWKYDIPSDVTNFCFVRVNSVNPIKDWGAKTVNLTIQNDGKDLYTITNTDACWGSGDCECSGTWSVYAKFYIIGINDVWEPNAIKSTTDSYTVENVSAGHHAFKISEDGTWATSKGLANITESNKYLYPDQDGNVCFYLSEAADVTITYIAGTPTFTVSSSKFALPPVKVIGDGELFGDWVAANAKELTPAQDELTATRTFTLTKDQHAVFKMIRGGDWLTQEGEGPSNYGLNRGWPSVSGLYRDGEGKKCIELSGDLAGDYIFTWTYATGTLTITFPDPTLENGFYLVGKFNGVPEWTVETLTAAKQFTWNKHIGEENEEWKITADLHLGDEFKAAYVYLDAITEYIPKDEEIKYVVTNEAQVGTMTIYFQQKHNDTWGGHFYVDSSSPATGIDNNEVSAKAVKRLVNGQLVIEKNGKTFNALGAEVK